MKTFFLTIFVFLSLACTSLQPSDAVKLKLSSGKQVTVYLEEQTIDDERLLVIDYKSDTTPVHVSDLDSMAEQIWEAVRPEADKRGLSNALLKLRIPSPEQTEGGTKKYQGMLYEAEKIENGSWKLKKVN